jgi:hypothetical protein
MNSSSPKSEDDYVFFALNNQSIDDDIAGKEFPHLIYSSILFNLDFCSSNDERIKSYLTYQDWYNELRDANENRWIVDQNKFNRKLIAQEYDIWLYIGY